MVKLQNLPPEGKPPAKLILALQKAVVKSFSEADWKELGYKTGTEEYISAHGRLLRSHRFGDDDYGSHVFDALEYIIDLYLENLDIVLATEKIRSWLKENEPAVYAEFAKDPAPVPSFRPSSVITTEVVKRAITDAETLIQSSGATSGVDRIHTALHGYLLAICDNQKIQHSNDPSITELFKLLKEHHPALGTLGTRSQDIAQILRAFSSILDVMNPLRNKASVAHPNQSLLDEDEAMLVINAARTILHYLDAKLLPHLPRNL